MRVLRLLPLTLLFLPAIAYAQDASSQQSNEINLTAKRGLEW